MKLQYLAVIFIVIILPISMVLSYHIQTQIDTINMQVKYDAKLNNATYDALKAFQINTVNNRYSTISNSKIRDLEASISTFYNSFIENELLSKEELLVYIPSMLYTLYDGYYIYSRYDNVYSEKNQGIANLNTTEINDGLKPYIYYSCRYKRGTKDFVVNFTLDNSITVYGDLGNGYETKSGYLINPNAVEEHNSNQIQNWYINYGTELNKKVRITPEILTEHIAYLNEDGSLNDGKANENDFEYLVYDGKKVYYDKVNDQFFWYDNYRQTYINDAVTSNYARQRVWNGHLHSTSGLEFLHNAKEFSQEIVQKLGGAGAIRQIDAVDTNGEPMHIGITEDGKQTGFVVNTGTDAIFDTTLAGNDPLLSSSTFNENRMAVIRNSITTNLAAAMANYNNYSGSNYEYALPILQEADWNKLTNEICMASFLQGIPIGHKYYNNYCVLTNNSNEEVVNKNNIYLVTTDKDNSGNIIRREYHLPGCTHLTESSSSNMLTLQNEPYANGYSSLSFLRQTLRISEGDYQYFYPQMRENSTNKNYLTACYYCIVNAGYTYSPDEIIQGKVTKTDESIMTTTNSRFKKIREEYLKALFRERHDLYQTNMDNYNID